MAIRFTKPRNVTYMGRAAKVWDALPGTNRLGERVSLTRWIEQADERNGGHAPGTIVATHHTGDGTKRSYVRHAEQAFTGENAHDIASAWAIERLTGRSIDGDPIDCTPGDC